MAVRHFLSDMWLLLQKDAYGAMLSVTFSLRAVLLQ